MKYIPLVILLVVAVILIIHFVLRKRNASDTKIVFVPSGLSDERVSKLGLKQVPQQDPGILRISEIGFPRKKEIIHKGDYRGTDEVEWIVDIHPPKNFTF